MVTPIVRAVENHFRSFHNTRLVSILWRSTLVISSIIVAIAIPFFGYLMSLVGAFLSITASVILPCLCYLKISGIHQRFGFEMMFIIGIVVIGVAIMIVGTYTSLKEIIGHLVWNFLLLIYQILLKWKLYLFALSYCASEVDIILDIMPHDISSLDCLKYRQLFHPIIYCQRLWCQGIYQHLSGKIALFYLFSMKFRVFSQHYGFDYYFILVLNFVLKYSSALYL